MLDLEIIPERSLRCENCWEFVLGKYKLIVVIFLFNYFNIITLIWFLVCDGKVHKVIENKHLVYQFIRIHDFMTRLFD